MVLESIRHVVHICVCFVADGIGFCTSTQLVVIAVTLLVTAVTLVGLVARMSQQHSRSQAAHRREVVGDAMNSLLDEVSDGQEEENDSQLDVMYTKEEVVWVKRMPWTADSLFAAVVHQIHSDGTAMGTARHKKMVASLRAQAVHYMRSYRFIYHSLLMEAIAQRGNRYVKLPTDEARVTRFLSDLARPTFWPGIESLVALAAQLGVLLTVYVEKQDKYHVPENVTTDVIEELRLAQKFIWTEQNGIVSHFDSVVNVEPLS